MQSEWRFCRDCDLLQLDVGLVSEMALDLEERRYLKGNEMRPW